MLQAYEQPNFLCSFPSEFVLHVQINRPKKLNAFNTQLWSSLRLIFDAASTDPDVRAVVLSAVGKAFTAGLDITENSISAVAEDGNEEADPARVATHMRRHILDFQDAISSLQRCAKPVVCCLHGIALGLGIDLASAADVRYASKETRFCIKEVDIGLAADIGSLQRLPYIVGNSSWMREMALTAKFFSADEALAQGFLSKVSLSPEQCTKDGIETAILIASKSPVAIQGTKMLLDYSRDHSVADGLLMTAVWNAGMLQARDVKDAIMATLSKQSARFSKL